MYCKNCGRQLKEGMRFCDRCGQSVRKNKPSAQEAKRQEIEELKNERLNRKKRLAEKEAKQARSKKRKKKNSSGFMFVIVVVLIAILSVIIGYNIFAGGTGEKVSPSTSPNAMSTTIPASSPSADVSKKGYTEIKIGSVTCPYPSAFHSNTTTGNEKLNLTDAFGGASMIVSQEAKMGEPKDIMAEYASRCDEITYSRAGSDWYAITSIDDGVVTHRKCVVRSGLAVYYDFSYNADSASAEKYTEQIEYIDANFK